MNYDNKGGIATKIPSNILFPNFSANIMVIAVDIQKVILYNQLYILLYISSKKGATYTPANTAYGIS
jgi:hypothetical protein